MTTHHDEHHVHTHAQIAAARQAMTTFAKGLAAVREMVKQSDDAQRHIADREERLVSVTVRYWRDGKMYRKTETFGESEWRDAHQRVTASGGIAERLHRELHERHLKWRRRMARRARRG